jgi:hypothetical protein
MKRLLLIFAFGFFLFPSITFAQKKIEQSKEELKSSKELDGKSGKTSKRCSNDADADDVSLFFDIAFGVFKYGLIGDYSFEEHLDSPLTPYPFYNNESGNYAIAGEDMLFTYAGRIDLENNFLYSDNNLFGNHLKAKIRPFQYFYVQADYHEIFESAKLTGENDHLSLFHFNLCYDRFRLERFNFGWNIGASYVGNEVRKAGFSYGLSMDIFFDKHLTFSGAAKWSQINGHSVNAYELQTKYHKKKYFFALGYEHLKIASPNYNFIALGGGIYY